MAPPKRHGKSKPQAKRPAESLPEREPLDRWRPWLAEQLTAEYFVKTEGRGRTVDEWKSRPEQPDNHWFDCLVGCTVAGSIQGAALPTLVTGPQTRQRRIKLSEFKQSKP